MSQYIFHHSRLIFKARSQTLDIKTQMKWKYNARACIGCKTKEETSQEIMTCEKLNSEKRIAAYPINLSAAFDKNTTDIVKAAILRKKYRKLEYVQRRVCFVNVPRPTPIFM